MRRDLVKLIEENRLVTADWHFRQADDWLDYGNARFLDTPLIYACLETRLAIERVALELLVLLSEQQLPSTQEERCRERIQDARKLIEEIEPDYRKRMRFTSIVMEQIGGPPIAEIDMEKLKQWWLDLSKYIHGQVRPEQSYASPDRQFQKEGYALVREILGTCKEWFIRQNMGVLDVKDMQPEITEIYQKFQSGELNEAVVARLVQLARPVLESRQRAQQ
jgi:hypothetical protein